MTIQEALKAKAKNQKIKSNSLSMIRQNKTDLIFWLLENRISDKSRLKLLKDILEATDWELEPIQCKCE